MGEKEGKRATRKERERERKRSERERRGEGERLSYKTRTALPSIKLTSSTFDFHSTAILAQNEVLRLHGTLSLVHPKLHG